jgi:putative endonuclease
MTAERKQAVGAFGERVAERHLRALGLVLLERNWRCDEGELDLVLRDGSTLVACEVKTRSSHAYGSPHEAITPAKLDRLRRLALRWAVTHHSRTDGIRIDLVAVVLQPRGAPVVEHIPGLL